MASADAWPESPRDRLPSLDEAREWCVRNQTWVDIQVWKVCDFCEDEFEAKLAGGMVSIRYCSRECYELAHPPKRIVFQPSGRLRRRR